MKIMKEQECCDYLGIKRVTLWRWRKEKGLPFVSVGRTVMFPQKLIDEWLIRNIRKGEVK